jgi:nitrogen fixation NifU-like protein
MDVYAENVLDHYRHPRNKVPVTSNPCLPNRQAQPATAVTHTEENLSCGDTVTIHLSIDNDRIAAISWDGTGCAISQAAMSMLSEDMNAKSASEVEALTPQNVYNLLGVPIGPRRTKCALLGLHTLKNAMRKNMGKELQNWTETVGSTS